MQYCFRTKNDIITFLGI